MKKITYTIGFAFALLATTNAVAQQGFGTNRPDKSAAIEIQSPNKGLLIPRISLTSETDTQTIVNPANSLLIYNMNKELGLHEGFYYYKSDANKWIPLLDDENLDTTTVTQDGQNLSVIGTSTTNINGGTTTDYKVRITPGTDKQFLATYDDGGILKTTWIDYNDIINTIEATNGLTKIGNTIKLGGTLTEDTTIVTDNRKVMIQGLSQVLDMQDQVIAVGHFQTGEIKVATPEQIVSKGLTHDLVSISNEMTSTINGVDKVANIINTNALSLDVNNALISTVNNVASTPLDLGTVIQGEQLTYEVKSTDSSVVVTPSTTGNLTSYDLSVTGVNAGIQVGNGISKDSTDGDRVVLGGTLDRSTTINTAGNDVMIQGLTTVTSMADQVIAVGHSQTGLLKVATPEQIVSAGISADNGLKINATNPGEVNLGGTLNEKTTIKTSELNTLAFEGLQNNNDSEKTILVLDSNNVIQKSSLTTSNAIATKSANYAAIIADETILVDASLANVTITLPAAEPVNKGKRFYVKLIKTNTQNTNEVRITSLSNIDGLVGPDQIASSSPYQAWMLQSDGVSWFVVGN